MTLFFNFCCKYKCSPACKLLILFGFRINDFLGLVHTTCSTRVCHYVYHSLCSLKSIQTTAKINITIVLHIALIPKNEVMIPPVKAPEKNERMIIKYRMERMAASVSFLVIARYKAWEAERKLPVDIVVLNWESTNLRKEET